jgi:hypothetical protein
MDSRAPTQARLDDVKPRRLLSGDLVAVSIAILAVCTLPLSALAADAYPGRTTIYISFSLAFAATLASAVLPRTPYAAVCACAFLWLGVWAKMTAHLLFDYRAIFGQAFMEPTGRFGFSPAAWDDVLLTCTVGALGMCCAVVGVHFYERMRGAREPVSLFGPAPTWYPRYRRLAWAYLAAGVVALIAFNETFAVLKLGFRPAVLLPWPLSGLYPWLFYVGVAVVIAVLAGWEMHARRSLVLPLTAAAAAGWALAASMLSRSAFLFQAGPYLLVLLREPKLRAAFGTPMRTTLIAAFAVLFVTSLTAVTYARYLVQDRAPTLPGDLGRGAQGAKTAPAEQGSTTPPDEESRLRPALEQLWSVTRGFAMSMAVDRWPGLEGVMTVSAAPEKGWATLRETLGARRTVDEVDPYTRMAESPFSDRDTRRFQYASIPGPIAIWYTSGSRWTVFFGMMALGLIAIAAERLIGGLVRNAFLESVVGMYLAVMITQMTPGLSQKAFSLLAMIGLCWGLQAIANLNVSGNPDRS